MTASEISKTMTRSAGNTKPGIVQIARDSNLLFPFPGAGEGRGAGNDLPETAGEATDDVDHQPMRHGRPCPGGDGLGMVPEKTYFQ